MKLTKHEIESKAFHIVPPGFQVLPPAHYDCWQIVTEERAVLIGTNIYCTSGWHRNLMVKISQNPIDI